MSWGLWPQWGPEAKLLKPLVIRDRGRDPLQLKAIWKVSDQYCALDLTIFNLFLVHTHFFHWFSLVTKVLSWGHDFSCWWRGYLWHLGAYSPAPLAPCPRPCLKHGVTWHLYYVVGLYATVDDVCRFDVAAINRSNGCNYLISISDTSRCVGLHLYGMDTVSALQSRSP